MPGNARRYSRRLVEMFWEDDISKKLEMTNMNASKLWKASNLLFVSSITALILGVLLIVAAASVAFFLGASDLSTTLKLIVPIIGLLLFILAGVLFAVYTLVVAILALMLNDIAFGIVIFLIGITAPIYKYWKANEIRGKGKVPSVI